MERNITLDYFKIFLSVLVITIHFHSKSADYYSDLATSFICNGIARIAVPCFFIINGFYLYRLKDRKSIGNYLSKILVF